MSGSRAAGRGPVGTGGQGGDGEESGPARERLELLAARVEPRRLGRARSLASGVAIQVAEPDLVIAAVGAYNVVVDAGERRILHGCRDFQGEARSGRLCKHVAAVLLRLDPALAVALLRSMAEAEPGWSLEAVASARQEARRGSSSRRPVREATASQPTGRATIMKVR